MGACKLYSTKLKVEDMGETLVGRRVCSLVLSSLASILKAGWPCSSTGDAWRGCTGCGGREVRSLMLEAWWGAEPNPVAHFRGFTVFTTYFVMCR